MAVIKKTFSGTLDSITSQTYKITGLTSETSSTSISYMRPEITLHFLRSLYQALLDSGYDDTIMNEDDYSITVLGFKFFVICSNLINSTDSYGVAPCTYSYGVSNYIGYKFNPTDSDYYSNAKYYTISSSASKNKILEYNITIRGDKNCVCVSYGSHGSPNATIPLIFIAKAKNIITSEDMYFFTGYLEGNNDSSTYASAKYFRKASDIYSTYRIYDNTCSYYSRRSPFTTAYNHVSTNNTLSKFVVEPVIADCGTIIIPSMIMCNVVNFTLGSYYKIGTDIYYCNGYKFGNSNSYEGQWALYKVSD